jgi:hypothetical protein
VSVLGPVAQWFRNDPEAFNTRVSVDLRDVSVREAARRLSDQIKRPITVDADVPENVRVSVRADNVPLATVLDLISQAAGARWGSEFVADTGSASSANGPGNPNGTASSRAARRERRYRIGKSVPSGTHFSIGQLLDGSSAQGGATRIYSDLLRDGIVYGTTRREQRATFTCPHCKRKRP